MTRDLSSNAPRRDTASRPTRRVDAAARLRAENARRRLASPPPRRSLAGIDLGPRRPPITVAGQDARFPQTSPAGRAARADVRWGGYHGSAATADRFPRRTGIIGLTVILGLLVTGVGLQVRFAQTPLWAVQKIEVFGNRVVSQDQVMALCGVEVGTPWWSAIRSLGRQQWQDLPRVESAHLRLSGWGGLAVDITERQPVLRWIGQAQRGLADDGTLLEFAPHFDALDLPCVSGAIAMDSTGQTATVLSGSRWYAALMNLRRESPALWAGISQIEIESERRFSIFFRDAQCVVLWDPHINEHLWEQVPGILQDLNARGVAGDAVLDLRFRDRVVVRIPEELWHETWGGEPDGASVAKTAAEGART